MPTSTTKQASSMNTLNQYNLDEQFATKTINQIKAMMTTRKNRELEASEHIEQYGEYPYSDLPKHVTSVKKASKVIDDCNDWINAAFPLFSNSLWDEMVADVFGCLEGRGSFDMNNN